MYSVQFRFSTSGTVIHYICRDCQFSSPMEFPVLNRNVVFRLHNVLQEHNLGVKQDMPVWKGRKYTLPFNEPRVS